MAVTNHHDRAARLRDYIAGLHHPLELDEGYGVELDGEIPKVPQRFVAHEYDGDESRPLLADTLEEMSAVLADLGGGDYSYAPGDGVLDLDTGWTYSVQVKVELTRLTWQVTYKLFDLKMEQLSDLQRTSGPFIGRYATREAAVAAVEMGDDPHYKVLDLTIERVAPDE